MILFLKLHRRFLIDKLQIFIRKKGIKSYKKTAKADFELSLVWQNGNHPKTSVIGFRKSINGLFELERKCKKYFHCLIITILSRLHANNWNVLCKLLRVVLTKRWKQDCTITNEWVNIYGSVKVCFTPYLQLIVCTFNHEFKESMCRYFWERPRVVCCASLMLKYFSNIY